ncbi:MAG: FG-GAP-like repeat-containing protein [bacterium]
MKTFVILVAVLIAYNLNLFASSPEVLWSFDLQSVSFGNSCADDIDEDGKLEIVFSTYFQDESIYALNSEDGSILWSYKTNGANDAAPIIYDVDMDGKKEVILHNSSNAKLYCFNGLDGTIKWMIPSVGTDSPPSIADVDGDGKPEILGGNFAGDLTSYKGETGEIIWTKNVVSNAVVQTEPVIADLDGDGQLDCVVASWRFENPNRIAAFKANDGTLLWNCDIPNNKMYHGPTIADIDDDGKQEVIIGTYDGILYCLNGIDGTVIWTFQLQNKFYIGAPTSIGDINGDGKYEIAYVDYFNLVVLRGNGTELWRYQMKEYSTSFRGVIFTDMNNDKILDVVFGHTAGELIALNGPDGSEIFNLDLRADYGKEFDINNAPICADFNGDGFYELFVIGGHGESTDITKNHGRAYMVSTNSTTGPEWLMFRRNHKRNAVVGINESAVEENLLDNAITLSPNPAKTNLRITSNFKYGTIEVYNLIGFKLINSDFTDNLDISGLSQGVYLCKIISGNIIETGIFVVIR